MFDYPRESFPDNIGKANQYLTLLQQALSTGDLTKGPFTTMVKSGEVYFGGKASGAFWIDDSRPRNIMVPAGVGYSVHAAIQWMLWGAIKQAEPGFVQGLNSE